MSSALRKRIPYDPTIYPVEEKVGEDLLQRWIVELLRPLLARWFDAQGIVALVGADQFIYYQQHNPIERVAPDVYVLPGVAPNTRVRSWKTWETSIVPSFALEIVSLNWGKDYLTSPARYGAMGVPEVIVFDPAPTGPERTRWQVFRRVRGELRKVESSDADRVRSRALGCYLRAVGAEDTLRLRLATGPRGAVLFPTEDEAERAAKEAERAAKEAERAAKEAERAAKEAERAATAHERSAKEAALARVAELEAELGRRPRR
ncbi:MAG TPA: Uma2 family endonuclease [Polyangiaceae bacterium]|jgi:Uma2 family endonuclease